VGSGLDTFKLLLPIKPSRPLGRLGLTRLGASGVNVRMDDAQILRRTIEETRDSTDPLSVISLSWGGALWI
jgi:hypothetical protein